MCIRDSTYPIADPVPVQVMTLSGELDASNYLDVIERVRQLYEGGTRQLVIDLSNVSFLSSSGLVALHSAALVMRGDEPPSPDLGWSAFHAIASDVEAVSYTHLDVYKRQGSDAWKSIANRYPVLPPWPSSV